jgi:hypothetical protein
MNTIATGTSPAAAEIEELGWAWSEDATYDLSSLSTDRRIQVRDSHTVAGEFAPRDGVEKIAVQMGHTVFPPVIVTADGWLVDGNTRVGAKLKRGEKFAPAIVLDLKREGATEKLKHELAVLGGTMNAQNGREPSARERREAVAHHLALGHTYEQIERRTGITKNQAQAIGNEIKAADRLEKVGVDVNGTSASVLRTLGQQSALDLHDAPYKELASLAVDADLKVSEVKDVLREVKKTGSPEGETAVLKGHRSELAERIVAAKLTGHGKPIVSAQLRQALGRVNALADRRDELVERNPANVAKHEDAIHTAITLLEGVLEAQRQSGVPTEPDAQEAGS